MNLYHHNHHILLSGTSTLTLAGIIKYACSCGWKLRSNNVQISCHHMLQVAVEELVNYYRSMKRLRTICWFAQTVISSQWCETAAHRSTAPENARKSRETSTAGESFFLIPQSLQVSYSSGNIYMFGFFFWCLPFGNLSTAPPLFLQSFQLSKAQQEMPLASF